MNNFQANRLLLKIADGDNHAFEKLYESTVKGVYSFIYNYLGNKHDTEDAVQSVYLKIKRGIHSYRPGTNAIAWILQIAKNQALSDLKKRRNEVSIDYLVDTAAAPQTTVDSDDGVLAVMKRVLSAEEAEIVTLHVLVGYKHREIAEQLGIPTGTVTSKYKRAVEKMRGALKEEGL